MWIDLKNKRDKHFCVVHVFPVTVSKILNAFLFIKSGSEI